jgi:predicted enzyme related to lactoylglutathione lyase
MHRSRLGGLIIDCRTDDLGAAGAFWSRALGLAVARGPSVDDPDYVSLARGPGGLDIEVQRVEHPSRVHLDIEADDVEAEVRRLEDLGARRIVMIRDWWVLEAPTGQRFCVVPAKSPAFDATANRWP